MIWRDTIIKKRFDRSVNLKEKVGLLISMMLESPPLHLGNRRNRHNRRLSPPVMILFCGKTKKAMTSLCF